ncbi:Cys-tRNA(Pro) deacylase [Arthrobacter sp. Sa2BUA2]|uniref:Cys-tRNA(Pro)/Cys-tRNA(Cys) deacylase n=1 Tax=Arthrobacter pullicola TaxID=2762224 RepID=A0ABR8YI58_9MICC|nr:Cys-tRNA(Pro) deacylase [Arthrobacter pullicola]MBD8043907.1 Cys-tRNA(Pro) deacylase [Arthrobacter pullicola]
MAGGGKQGGRSATPATRALDAAGVSYRTMSYEHDPSAQSYGLEAAEKLGVPAEAVFKTLMVSVEGRLAVAMVPVAGSLDLKKVASLLGSRKAVIADRAEAEKRTGYVVGGISPLGQRLPSPAVIDSSAEALESIYVSGGRRGFEIVLSPSDLIRLTSAAVGPIAVYK